MGDAGPDDADAADADATSSALKGRATRKAVAAAVSAHVAVLEGKPLRAAIAEALAKGGNLGGQERRFIAFACRELSRHSRWVDLLVRLSGHAPGSFKLPQDTAVMRYAMWRHEVTGADVERVMTEVGLPGPVRPRSMPDAVVRKALETPREVPHSADELDREATRHSFPRWLAVEIERAAPRGELAQVLAALNREPPLMLRARPPGTRDEVAALLAARGIGTQPVEGLADALVITDDSRAVFDSGPMKTGRLLVMDEGSQRLAELTRLQPGQTAVDYCAGAGGKTLVLADLVGERGRVLAWDNSPKRLAEARRRVSELKLRHVSFPTNVPLGDADVVLIDAPCSGSGTLAREPDQKWKLSLEKVQGFAKTQLQLLDVVARAIKPQAAIVYGTCSVLVQEDEDVVAAFLASHPDFHQDGPALRVWPHHSSGGGFFGARLTRA